MPSCKYVDMKHRNQIYTNLIIFMSKLSSHSLESLETWLQYKEIM